MSHRKLSFAGLVFVLIVSVLGLAILTTGTPGSSLARSQGRRPALALPAWLVRINRIRRLGGLPPVESSRRMNRASRRHSAYIVRNDTLSHSEDPALPWYTPDGAAAGGHGNVMAASNNDTSNLYAIDSWATGPFHALALLDPRVTRVGFGSVRDDHGPWRMAATLDVEAGSVPVDIEFPLRYPAPGSVTDLREYGGSEYPDPLTGCAGYDAPAGAPIILQLGNGSHAHTVVDAALKTADGDIEHCVFDETTYRNPDPASQRLGRLALDLRDAIVLMPREPLEAGTRYFVSIVADGSEYRWWFDTAPD